MCHTTAQGERYRELGGEIYSGEWEIRGRDTGRYRGYGEIRVYKGYTVGEIEERYRGIYSGTIRVPSHHHATGGEMP